MPTYFNKLTTEKMEEFWGKYPEQAEEMINAVCRQQIIDEMKKTLSVEEWESLYLMQPLPPKKEEMPQE